MKINKILLIVPPAQTFKSYRDINPLPPMGLGYIASIVERMGAEAKILDCLLSGWDQIKEVDNMLIQVGLSDLEIKNIISEYQPDLVGINCQFSRQYKVYHNLFSIIKEVMPKCISIAGGPHVTVCPDEVLNDPNCDFVVIGEGEESFKDLVEALNNGNSFYHIDGLGWKTKDKTQINPKQKWIEDLDNIPFPAFHLMDLESYFGLSVSHGTRHRERFMPIMTSRGCPAKCSFCSAHRVWGRKYRTRSIGNVISEMKLFKDKYKIEEIMFEDDNVTANPKRAKELFSKMIKEKFEFVWDTPNGVGVWSMDTEMIDLMKSSGCIKLNFPVESGSQHVLDTIIKKPLKLTKVKELITHCKKIGLDYSMFLVVGMPGETIKDIWESFHFVANCDCFAPHISVATPYPGTELFEICSKNGLFTKEFSLNDLFIRSYMIKTSAWNDIDLKGILKKGKLYLKYREIVKNPKKILLYLIKTIKKPSKLISFFKNP